MSDEELNPYAPPATGSQDPTAYRRRDWGDDRGADPQDDVDYESQRESVVLCFMLTLISCGLYPIYWLFKRKPFLESLRAREKLGALPVVMAVTTVIALLGSFTESKLGPILSLSNAVVSVVAFFRVRTILEQERIAMGAPSRLSAAATFFFSVYYLQYRINLMADFVRDVGPRRPRRKKKKKVRAKPEPAEESRASEPG